MPNQPRIPDNFDQSNLWKLIIDHKFIQQNPVTLLIHEQREPGCIVALLRAYRSMFAIDDLQILNSTISADVVAEEMLERTLFYHRTATKNVQNLLAGNVGGYFRNADVKITFPLSSRTEKGVKHLCKRKHIRGDNNEKIELYYELSDNFIVSCKQMSEAEISAIYRKLCLRLINDLRSPKRKNEQINYLAEFMQDIMLLHPFGDANMRTLAKLLLNDILFSLDEDPILFFEPKIVIGYDIHALAKEFKRAQQRYAHVISEGNKPADISRMAFSGILDIAIAAGEVLLVKAIFEFADLNSRARLLSMKSGDRTALQSAIEQEQNTIVLLLMDYMQIDHALLEPLQILLDREKPLHEVLKKFIQDTQYISEAAMQNLLPHCMRLNFAPKNIGIYLFLLARLSKGQFTADMTKKIDAHLWTLSDIFKIMQATEGLQEQRRIKEFFKCAANLNISFRYEANDSVEIDDAQAYFSREQDFVFILLIRNLFGHKNSYGRKYLLETVNPEFLNAVCEGARTWSGRYTEHEALPLCLDIFFMLEFARKCNTEQRQQFANILLNHPDILAHIIIDLNSLKQLKDHILAPTDSERLLFQLLRMKKVLEKITNKVSQQVVALALLFKDVSFCELIFEVTENQVGEELRSLKREYASQQCTSGAIDNRPRNNSI